MMEREARARELFLAGNNCAQSVLMAFADVVGLTEEQAALVAVGFGGGMGRLRQNCGAYSAMVMVCGALSGSDGASSQRREEVYARVQQVERLFRETFGTTQCAELLRIPPKAQPPKPAERTTAYYDSRPCTAIVAGAARLLEELMLQTQEEQGCAR